MEFPYEVQQIDRLLDELDAVSQRDVPIGQFFREVLSRLVFLLEADNAWVVYPVDSGAYVVAADYNGKHTDAMLQWLRSYQTVAGDMPQQLNSAQKEAVWLGCGLRGQSWQAGGIAVALSPNAPKSVLAGLQELLRAFSEILAEHQNRILHEFVDRKWNAIQTAVMHIQSAESNTAAAACLVNDTRVLLNADRVSLVKAKGSFGELMMISNTDSFQPKSDIAKALAKVGMKALSGQQPYMMVSWLSADLGPEEKTQELELSRQSQVVFREAGGLSNAIAIPFIDDTESPISRTDSKKTFKTRNSTPVAIIIEWQNEEACRRSLSLLKWTISPLRNAWLLHDNWSRIPRWVRKLATGPAISLKTKPLIMLAASIAIVLFCGYLATLPTTMRIEARGAIEPINQRVIFATADGYVQNLMVADGQRVDVDEVIVALRSPSLELQLQTVSGELQTLQEKRNGLNVAINQAIATDSQSVIVQSKISAEIKEIDQRVKNLLDQQSLLLAEQSRLTIRSPIAGIIVARDAKQTLASKPVRRGDALLRIADTGGPWHLKIWVPDYDAGHIIRQYTAVNPLSKAEENEITSAPDPDMILNGQGTDDSVKANQVSYLLASSPKVTYAGTIQRIAKATQQTDEYGAAVEVVVSVDQQRIPEQRMGATVIARFDGGTHPYWFVLARPIIETIQRRMWF